MKKLITICLAIILVMSFAACDKTPEATSGENTTATNTNETNVTEDTTTPDSTENTVGKINEVETTAPNTESAVVTDPTHTHNHTQTVTAPTCINDGYTTYACACGDKYVSDKTAAVGHKYGEWATTKEPTKTKTGMAERKCTTCNATETKTLGKLTDNHTHSYTSKITAAATCTKAGTKTFTCSCGESYTEVIAKTDHNYKATVVNATCTNGGYTSNTCSMCGDSYVHGYTGAIGHSYNDNVVKATCTVNGYTKHTCSRCGATYNDAETNATGHSYEFTSDTATCTSNGTKTETCTKCGDKKTSTTNAFGHTTKTESVKATCVTDGYTKESCATCGTVLSNTTIVATGKHNYKAQVVADVAKECVNQGDWSSASYTSYTDWLVNRCTTCGYCVFGKMYFRYTEYEAATIMLNYVNNLRAELYGTHDYDLVLDDTLMDWSKTRAKAISVDYSHNGAPITCAENISCDGYGIYNDFVGWCNSPGHYKNIINKDYTTFGYAIYIKKSGADQDMCSVQLFR